MEQRTSEWFELRKSHIGASDAPVIMGVSPWKTPLDLWKEKVCTTVPTEISPFMQRGIDLEPEALQTFERLTGYLMTPKVVFHPKINWMMASLDGLDLDGNVAVEIKCPGKKDHEIALDGAIPPKYIPQLQHQLETTGLNKIYYFSYSLTSYKVIEVYRDENYIGKLIDKESEFWECIANKTAPDSEIDSIEWEMAAIEWKNLQQEIERISNKEKELKEKLIMLAGNSNAKGCGISLKKVLRKGNIDYTTIPEIKEIDLEKYRKPASESWRITNNE